MPRDGGNCTANTELDATGAAIDGEVEDYAFSFTPTAVSLQSVNVVSESTVMTLFGSLMLLLLASGATAFVLHQNRKKQLIEEYSSEA